MSDNNSSKLFSTEQISEEEASMLDTSTQPRAYQPMPGHSKQFDFLDWDGRYDQN